MRARYWRGLLRLTFMPHSARKESVAASKVPFPGKAKRISFPALIDIAPFPGSREAYQMFFPALQVAHRHRVLPLLIAANDQRQAHLFFSSQSQACANAVSRHIHLGAQASGSYRAGDAQSIGKLLHADRDNQRLYDWPGRQIGGGNEREQALYAKGKAAGVDITDGANGAQQRIIATAAAELRIEAVGILRVYLKDEAGVIADAATERKIEENMLARDSILYQRLHQLFQFLQGLRVKLVTSQQFAQGVEDGGWRACNGMQGAQKFQRVENLPPLLSAPHLPEKTFHHLMPHIIIPERDADAAQQRAYIAFLHFRHARCTLCSVTHLFAQTIHRVECLKPGLSQALAVLGAADLLHQTEQEAGGVVVEMEAIDEATGDADVTEFQPILLNLELRQHVTGQLHYFGISCRRLPAE